MVKQHNYTFFGREVALTVQSSSWSEDFLFLRCIKKKEGGSWEKPSQGEGKSIKISLDEMVMILQVLTQVKSKWTGHHTFKDQETNFVFEWEGDENDLFWAEIGEYKKPLDFSNVEVFRRLLEHLLDEKIEHATVSKIQRAASVNKEQAAPREPEETQESIPSEGPSAVKDASYIKGFYSGETEKAILIDLRDRELWFPKSTIHSEYVKNEQEEQAFLVDNWILRKSDLL